jgi:hypothetical protein
MDNRLLVIVGAVLVLLVVGALVYARRRRSDQLAQRFGPEYGRAVEEFGGKRKAEAELAAREKRFEKAHVRALSSADRDRFAESWRSAQARFVDSPAAAVAEADDLIEQVMRVRGYPLGDPAQRLADVALAHPHLLDHYREACERAGRQRDGKASTEDLRQAMVHYRALFEELLEVRDREREPELVGG